MKVFLFLRNAWSRKENKQSPAPELLVVEQVVSTFALAGTKFNHSDPVLPPRREPSLEVKPNAPSRTFVQDPRRPIVGRPGGHGPPLNASHGPPSLPLFNKPYRNHSSPPSLDSLSRPATTSRPPSRLKFAEPEILRTNRGVQDNTNNLAFVGSDVDVVPHPIRKHSRRPATAPGGRGITIQGYQTVDEKTGKCSSVDLSKLPTISHHSTDSGPPLSPQSASDMKTEESRCDVSAAGLSPRSLQTTPQSLSRKRRPRPLVIPPVTRATGLPPSPFLSSADSTPLGTPTTPVLGLIPSPKLSPNSGYRGAGKLRAFGLPPHSPPDSPLPTPPVSPTMSTHTPPVTAVPKTLRVAHSTSDFRGRCYQLSPASNQKTTSASAPELSCQLGRRAPASPPHLSSQRVESSPTLHKPSPEFEQVHYGYAI